MARRNKKQARHLGAPEAGSKARHRGRKVLAAVLVCALLAAAGVGGYAAWTTTQQGTEAPTEQQAPQESVTENATSGEAATNESPNAGQDSATANESETDASEQPSDGSSSDEGAAEETPQRQVGEHDAPTADDEAAMASLGAQVSILGAPTTFTDSAGYQELLYQAVVWQRYGYDLAFVLTDIDSGATVSYNTDQVFYPASSIKGPFVCSLYQEVAENGGGGSQLDSLASRTIIDSDNEAFRSLHQTFGESAFLTWLQAAGVPATSGQSYGYFASYYYPHVSCSQLNLMWSAIYRYCTSGTASSQTLAGYFASRTTSPIAQAVASREASWGKAGWYYSSGDYGAEPATVDAGVVFAEKGPYQIVMMSSAPGELDRMAELAYGMDQAAVDLAG